MSLNYTNQYIQSLLSFLDYVSFNGKNELNIDLRGLDLTTAANKKLFDTVVKNYMKDENAYNEMKSSLDFFTQNFLIVNQNIAAAYNGFSATTYQLIRPIEGAKYKVGEIFVSYRGTESDEAGDILTDIKLTFTDQIVLPYTSQEPLALNYLKEALYIAGNNNVNISGHSLGGYLAARSYYHLTEAEMNKIGEVSTFNGAGFSVIDLPFFDFIPFLNLSDRELYAEKINNIFSFRGLNVTTSNIGEMFDIGNIMKGQGTLISTFQHLGPRIGKFTENPGGATGNHSITMLAKSMGFFSMLSKLIQDVYIIKVDGHQYVGDDAVVYLIDRMLMGAVPDTEDFGKAYDTISTKLMEMFNVPKEITAEYSSPTAQFLSLANYFKENSNLKIKMFDSLYATPPVLTINDSNSNRAYMYALLNDLPFTVIVPETYNTGIYQKNDGDGFEYKNNIKYNVEYYTDDYIKLRTTYNKAYTAVLSDKILNNLPRTFTNATLNVDGFSKFAFIDEANINTNTSEINDYRVIFINTNKSEYLNDVVPLIYFKADNKKTLDVRLGNSIVYDTPNSDSIRVFSNNNIINSTYGHDFIDIASATSGNIIMLKELLANDQSQNLIVKNNSSSENSLTIKTEEVNLGQVIGKFNGNKDFTLDFGNKIVNVTGDIGLKIQGIEKSSAEIQALFNNFPELYTFAAGHNFIFDEQFIDDYIKVTAKNFEGQLGYENTQTMSAEHATYVIGKITGYTNDLNDTASSFIEEMKAHINSRITSISTDLDSDGIQDDILNQVIPLIQDKVKNRSVAFTIQSKLNNFKYLNLGNQVNMANKDSMADGSANNIYGKKETKNYISHYNSEGEVYYVWDGKYYYNRSINGVQLGAFYDGDEKGELVNYYNENITIKKDDLIANGIDIGSGRLLIQGSNGSDLLIGDIVSGQTNYRGTLDDPIYVQAKDMQNGNDILIGIEASAYSGNNFIYGSERALGGSGNDLIIGGGTIMANQQLTNDTESSNNENEIMILSSADVYSSNGKNNIIDLGNGTNNIFGTRNDTFIGGSGSSLFIGGYDAYYALKYKKISLSDNSTLLDRFRLTSEVIDLFYENHKNSQSILKNMIYAGTGWLDAVLGYGDYIENLNGGSGQIIALGRNDIFVKDNTAILSMGDSNISITGNHNTVYLGKDDKYSLSNANNNTLYSRGYKDNLNLGNDSYQITGVSNSLILGKSSYSVKLDGENSNVTFTENNNNNRIIVNELGGTNIYVGTQNSLTVESESETSFRNGTITELIVNTKSSVWFENIVADSLVSNNYNGLNNTYVVTLSNMAVNDIYVSSGIITGSVSDVSSASLEGVLAGFNISSDTIGLKFKLNGFFEGVNNILDNVKTFNFTQSIRMYEQSVIEINNSNISSYTSSGNLRLTSLNTNIDVLNVNGSKNSISVDGSVGSAVLTSTSDLFFGAKSVKSLNASYAGVTVKGTDVNGNILLGLSMYGNSLMVDNANLIEISNSGYNSMFLSATNSDTINIISGSYNGAIFTNVNAVNINLDTVSATSSFNGDNIHLTSTKPLSARISNNKYYLNNVEFTFLPDTVTVSGRQYTSEQLSTLFEVLKKSNLMQATAIVDVTGIGYDSIGDTNNQGVHVDSGIYIGTDGNDIVYATDNKAYRIKAGKGNDEIDFGTKPRNSYTHIIEYNRGDGLDTITSNTENIEIRLGNISSTELSFKMIDDVITNSKVLKVYLANEQIFTINGFLISNILFKATDKTLSKTDVVSLTSTIYGTDNGEVIQGLTTDTYIVAGKGNDTINFIGSNKNVLYYNRGDGADIVNSVSKYEIIFGTNILKYNVKYSHIGDKTYDLYLDSIKILTLSNIDNAKLIFSDGEIVDSYITSSLSEQLGGTPFYENGIYTGSDLIDYFDVSEGSYHLNGNKGNDKFIFGSNSEHSILDYTEGDGIDIIDGYSKNIDINLINMSSEFLTTSNENDYLYLYYKGLKIMRIDEVDKSNINIHMADKSFTQQEIFIWMYGIDDEGDNGGGSNTDGDDIITINPKADNNIYGGKGNDIINLTSHAYYPDIINNIYYFEGDGHEIINNDDNSNYKILLADTMLESDISYVTGFDNGQITLNILHKNEMIFTIPNFNANQFKISYLSSGNSINMMTLFRTLTMVDGTDNNDFLTSEQAVAMISAGDGDDVINLSSNIMAADVYGGLGNDIININNHGFNSINYDDGNGYDTIVLENHETSINLNLYDYDEVNIRFEYDIVNPNNLNIYNDTTKIITIENYVIDDVPFESIVIELNDSTLESQDINTKASEGSQAARMLADSNINGLISIMAIDNNDIDSLGEGQSASTFIKKNE